MAWALDSWALACKKLAPQGLFKDPDILAYLLLARDEADHGSSGTADGSGGGWLPLSVLTQSRVVRQWLREFEPTVVGNHEAMTAALAERLREEGVVAPAGAGGQAAAGWQPVEDAKGVSVRSITMARRSLRGG